MLHQKILQRVTVLGVLWFGVSLAGSPAQAADWINPSGGNWFDFNGINWSNGFPELETSINFDTNAATGTYTVTIAGSDIGSIPDNYFVHGLNFRGASSGVMDVTFDLNNFTPTNPPTPPSPGFAGAEGFAVKVLRVGDTFGTTGTLRLVNGTLTSQGTSIGQGNSATSELNVGSDATLRIVDSLSMGGNFGSGTLRVTNGGTVDLALDFGNDTGVVYSLGTAELAGSTVAGGTIIAATGIQLGNSESLSGFGSVAANVGLSGGILKGTGGTFAVNGAVNGNGLIVKALGSDVTATSGFNASGTLNLTGPLNVANNTVTVMSQGTLALRSSNTFAGGTLNAANGVALGALESISGNGAVNGRFLGAAGSSITASGGNFEIGDAASFVGFNHAGELHAGDNTVTLNSRGFAGLGSLTTVTGGSLNAANGFALGTGDVLVAGSSVNGRIAAGFGSIIDATGDLNIGDAGAFDGFFSDGVLSVNTHTVTVADANVGLLGSLTTIDGGTLAAPNGLLLEAGKNIVGNG